MATKPTISDVAARAGVSKGAVSFALNGRPGVSPETRDRILQAAEDIGFTANSSARALANRRSGNLGLVMARSHETLGSDPFFPPFIAGIESAVAPSGVFLLVRLVDNQDAETEAYQELASTGRVDGVFLTDLRIDDPRPALLDKLGLLSVTLNRPLVPCKAPAICVDDGPAVRDAVRHLVGLGHRSIAHVGGPPTYLHAAHRRQVWADALDESGLPQSLIIETDFSAAGGAAATKELLDRPDRPTAILYANDLMAVAGLSVARQRDIRVPQDISVIGFDDGEISAYLPTPLTTVRTDVYGWGRAAATALQARVLGEQVADIDLPAAQLVVRESTGPAPVRRHRRTRRTAPTANP
ncbi:MAG: LacI family DNA-binding transcriptional regulator [Nakamurella sp.]